jgi:hypothetical protein
MEDKIVTEIVSLQTDICHGYGGNDAQFAEQFSAT